MTLWLLIAGCIVTTALIKAAGPVIAGGRDLPAWFMSIAALMAPALLAALVVTAALADGQRLGVGAHTAGVAVAGVLLWRGHSVVLAVGAAVVVTATLRTLA
ncbi:MAG: AzlD domain-containing protein [Actinomycetota bacterium]|nr:AzlD domain-containing protein [Actinomycetota bacterium]